MPTIVTNGYGFLSVQNTKDAVGAGKDKVVSVKTGAYPADLTRYETFRFIEVLIEQAGLACTAEEDGTLRLIAPENPRWAKRRYDLSVEYFKVAYERLRTDEQRVIDHLMALEKKVEKLEADK